MNPKRKYTMPQLTAYGHLIEIVRGGNDGLPPPNPPGWDGRTPVCAGGDGPGKEGPKPEAFSWCGSFS
jgi:hypothetical protein